MIFSRKTSGYLLILLLTSILALPAAAQVSDTLYQAIDDACTNAETNLIAALNELDWSKLSQCKASTFDEAECSSAVEAQINQAIQKQTRKLRKEVLGAMASQPVNQVGPLYKSLDRGLDQLSQRMPNREVLKQQLEKPHDPSALEQLSNAAVTGFGKTCRIQLIAAVSAGAPDDESGYLESLRKDTGFSQIVRCVWQSDGILHRLNCTPGLRVTGHDVAVIQILPPADESFRLRWVQALGTEELPGTSNREDSAYLDRLRCPGYEGQGKINLACDELCFSEGEPCVNRNFRHLKTQSAVVAVHTQRRFNTTYGCAVHRRECAQRRLRQNRDQTEPAKLTLLTKGRSPVIRVRAMNQSGEIAEGEVLVGYPRWRVESGGFMGIAWNAVDHEVVASQVERAPANDESTDNGDGEDVPDPGEVEVIRIGDSDTYAQETGIFVNFIPSNYEWIGASLGFATADGKAPSVYLGPTIRLTTFGNRGIAALSAGVVMRQVDRFPDLTVGQKVAADSRLLEPDRQFEVDGYLGIQLGFSFGPISVPDSED